MVRGLTNYEKETTINFNKEEKVAYIFTCEKTWQKHLEGKLGLKPLYFISVRISLKAVHFWCA